MNFEVSKEEKLLRTSAKEFTKKYLAEISFGMDKTGEFPANIIDEMAKADYLGITIPEEFGGLGLDAVSLAIVAEELGKECASIGATLIGHLALCANAIAKYGTKTVKETYLPKLAKGEILGGFATAEIGASVGSGQDKLVITKDGDSYILNGTKYFVANGGVAGAYVVAGIMDEELGAKSLTALVVDGATDGITVEADVDKLGVRSYKTATLSFKDVRVPLDNLLGEECKAKSVLSDVKALGDIISGAVAVGIAKNAIETCIEHTNTRVQFGAPIGKIQAVIKLLADMDARRFALESVTYRVAQTYAVGGDYEYEAALLKDFAIKPCFEIVTNAVQIHGGTGYSRESHIERLFRDMKAFFIIEDMSEMPELVISKALNR
ncbi:MAG: acyl-CoA dehydrogenase family protein [Anaerovoracaceae bacterium]